MAEFHLLRPWWLLLLLPAVTLLWLMLRRESGSNAWRGVIAPHLLRHLLVIRDRDVASMFLKVHEAIWERSRPLRAAADLAKVRETQPR